MNEKILILRFSSFGDIIQCLSVPAALKQKYPHAEIHWATRHDFVGLIETHPAVKKVWSLNRKSNLRDLISFSRLLAKENFTRVYDAHNSQRSRVIGFLIAFFNFPNRPIRIVRNMRRLKRFLLFKLRINLFEQPFSGQRDLLEPLLPWGIASAPLPESPQLFLKNQIIENLKSRFPKLTNTEFIALAPSAAFELKRWPLDNFKVLIQMMKAYHFILLGGPEDTFIEALRELAPDRVSNFAGLLTLEESAGVISLAKALVANDTGLLHVGEQLGIPTVALMGPAPFGFPSRVPQTIILEKMLSCRPCSKHGQGPCTNKIYQACLKQISPQEVRQALDSLGAK